MKLPRLLLRSLLITLFLSPMAAGLVHAQPAAPPPPKEYRVVISYRIRAPLNQRIAQFLALTRYLETIGFHKNPGPENEAEDAEQTRMTGTNPSANALKILAERHVRSILLIPAGYELPAQAEQPIKVRMNLGGKLVLPRQHLLAEQTVDLLRKVGFQEAIGYDNRGYTRVVGRLPAANVEQLLQDLRWQGSGWLVPEVPVAALPLPIRDIWPVEVVEVVPEPAGMPAAKAPGPTPPPAAGQEYLAKISPALRALAGQSEPVRMELILFAPPRQDDPIWRRDLETVVPGLLFEGRLAALVTVRAPPNRAAALAQLPFVSSIRLPIAARLQTRPIPVSAESTHAALAASGVARLQAQGSQGQGIRLAVIDTDFQGYQQFVGKQLPADTQLIDISAESEPTLLPSQRQATGHGTQTALAAALAAPKAQFVLVRVDPEAPYQLYEVARYLTGEPVYSLSLEQRNTELSVMSERLTRQRQELLQERRAVLENFAATEEAQKRRRAHFERETRVTGEERELQQRQQRYLDLIRNLRRLRGIPVVACSLVWDNGYPVDGTSPLTRYFDDSPVRGFWFQSVDDSHAQVWAGLFRDVDGNGAMEFAPPDTPLRPGLWTRELNFLGWQPHGKAAEQPPAQADLPAGHLRVTIQWREPHDPAFWEKGDPYRMPLANVGLMILRQRDPTGTRLPADDLELAAQSSGLPVRLDNAPDAATYEQSVDFAVAEPGRYALRVTGRLPRSIRPPNQPGLPALETLWELRPRLFVETLAAGKSDGRPIFWDYATGLGTIGTPADAHQAVSVAAADDRGQPEAFAPRGPAWDRALRPKPDLLSFGRIVAEPGGEALTTGPSAATAFAAGATACALSARIPAPQLWQALHARPGTVIRLP
jgi:hypothetical protein